jgi:hypothetical protein
VFSLDVPYLILLGSEISDKCTIVYTLLIVLPCVWKSDLLVKWGGVAPKMAEEAHALAIDKVRLSLRWMSLTLLCLC